MMIWASDYSIRECVVLCHLIEFTFLHRVLGIISCSMFFTLCG